MTAQTPHVTERKENGFFFLGMHRPEKLNALTLEMYEALAAAIARADADPDTRVVVFHGTERAFAAGNDLKDFLEHPPTGTESPVFRFMKAFRDAEKPIVAAVTGSAVGIGTTILPHCDLAVAGESAVFRMPFVALGLCPEAASSLFVPLMVGHARAFELLVLGRPFTAREALQYGLVNKVVPDGEVLAEATALARKLAALPPEGVRVSKRLLKRHLRDAALQTIEAEAKILCERVVSEEAKEAFRAFFEKREPDFATNRG